MLRINNLNQNASQLVCLYLHAPFILNEFHDHQNFKVCICVETRFKLVQTVSNNNIFLNIDIYTLSWFRLNVDTFSYFKGVFTINICSFSDWMTMKYISLALNGCFWVLTISVKITEFNSMKHILAMFREISG